jgi:hypothetical protein
MIGSQADPGMMVRVMEDLFIHSKNYASQFSVQYKVTVSFLEVYNENIRDLLSDVEEYLDLREDPIKGPVVASITEIETSSGQEIMQLLHQGNSKRSQAATAANEVSSRSHAVLQVLVECRDRAPGVVANIKVGKLSLVDLAGSERAANTKNVGQRLMEGANINRSLLALGNCINALGEKGNKGNFVPYRDSKLTRLLKDSLGGNCRTVMIANISSAESSFEETLNTLKYANRAKNIKTNVQRNVLNVNYHISEYVQLINNLRSEIQVLKSQIGAPSANLSSDSRIGSATHPNLLVSDSAGNVASVNSRPQNLHLPSRVLSPASPFIKNQPSTPFQALRESLKSGAGGGGAELISNMRQKIVDNFQERMQLRRSLIELEDQNVQNSIEVSKRQLLVVNWSERSERHGNFLRKGESTKADFAAYLMTHGTPEVVEAWQECEQLRKAIIKNNGMKKNIAKRLRHNEKDAEKLRDELSENVTTEDRRELMALQYQVGRLELENMELEQHRIVHESVLKGKDLVIQKLKLQLAVRDKIISRQQTVLRDHNLEGKVGYEQLALLEETLMVNDINDTVVPPSPPRNVSEVLTGADLGEGASCNDFSDDFISSSEEHNHGKNKNKNLRVRKNIAEGFNRVEPDGGNFLKPAVPPLRFNDRREHPLPEDENRIREVEEEQYNNDEEEEPPFTEREVALTSRDRDLIEQGEWLEIRSELSDQSFSLGNPGRVNSHLHRQKTSEPKSSNMKIGLNEQQQNPSRLHSIKETKGVHGPRGGRIYRSSGSSSNVGLSSYGNNEKNNRNKNPSSQSNDDISDDDSVNQKFLSKYRHYGSPRVNDKNPKSGIISVDKLEPLGKDNVTIDESGVFSGRKLEKEMSSSKIDVSPRGDAIYAVVYPSSISHSNNKKFSAVAFDSSGPEEKLSNHATSGNKRSYKPQLINREKLDQDESVEVFDMNISVDGMNGLVVKSKPLGSKPLLGKIKSRAAMTSLSNNDGNLSSLPSNASLISGENIGVTNSVSAELNVLGSGFEGMSSSRPANKAGKPSMR